MKEYMLMRRGTILRRNNNVLRWLANTFGGEAIAAGTDNDTSLEIVGLVLWGWLVTLDYRETSNNDNTQLLW